MSRGVAIFTSAALSWPDVVHLIEEYNALAQTEVAELTDHSAILFAIGTPEEPEAPVARTFFLYRSESALRELEPDGLEFPDSDEDEPDESRPMSREAMRRMLGGEPPQTCLLIDPWLGPGSGWLVVLFAALCAEHWPCVVSDVYGHIYSAAEIFALRAAKRDFDDESRMRYPANITITQSFET